MAASTISCAQRAEEPATKMPKAVETSKRGPILVTLKPYEHAVQIFEDSEPIVFASVLAFYSHTKHDARYEGKWEAIFQATGIDPRIFSNLADLEPFSLSSSWPSSLRHLALHECILKIHATNTERFFQAFKMTKELDATFVLSDMIRDPKDCAAFGQRRGLWLTDVQYRWFLERSAAVEEFVFEERPNGKNWKKKVAPRPDWDAISATIMDELVHIKFDAAHGQPSAARVMAAIRGYFKGAPVLFVEHTSIDSLWANGLTGEGLNKLGLAITKTYLFGDDWEKAPKAVVQPSGKTVEHVVEELRPPHDQETDKEIKDADRVADSFTM
jgi:predicted NAD-dependent protein-ADP-ribosyltransferase YbiA (DUF1768 family)